MIDDVFMPTKLLDEDALYRLIKSKKENLEEKIINKEELEQR